MDLERVKMIVQFAVAKASEKDEFFDRELGPIHLIKHVYLADLAYAETHDGTTFTGTDWTFYHFGPWDLRVFEALEPSLPPPFIKKTVPSRYDKDMTRWSFPRDDYKTSALEKKLPWECALAVQRAVKDYGKNTEALLHHVYQTDPMIRAKPGESLTFTGRPKPVPFEDPDAHNPALRRRLKKIYEKHKNMKKEEPPGYRGGPQAFFARGMAVFDALEEGELQETSFDVYLDPSIWNWGLRENEQVP